MLLAVGLLALSAAIVYLGRHGYRDAAHPGRPPSVLGSVYYATVTLSTIGYGDIVPVTAAARLVNTVVITPMRVIFLIILVGTTLEVLTTPRSRSPARPGETVRSINCSTEDTVTGSGCRALC
jgi:voltage-gated potassium channel